MKSDVKQTLVERTGFTQGLQTQATSSHYKAKPHLDAQLLASANSFHMEDYLNSLYKYVGSHCTSSRAQSIWKHFHAVQESYDGQLHQNGSLKQINNFSLNSPANKAHSTWLTCYGPGWSSKTQREDTTPFTLSMLSQQHMNEAPNKTLSGILTSLSPHALLIAGAPHPATAPAVCSCERETCPGNVTSSGSLQSYHLH